MHSLSESWFEYSELLVEDAQERLKDLRRQKSSADANVSDIAHHQLAALEQQLKIELISQVYAGKLEAYGRDISHDLNPPQRRLSSALFNPRTQDLATDWEASSILVFGKRIIDVTITLPNQSAQNQRSEKRKVGRPAHASEAIINACMVALERDAGFCGLSHKEAFQIVDGIIKANPQRHPALHDGAKLKTFRRVRNAFCLGAKAHKSQN